MLSSSSSLLGPNDNPSCPQVINPPAPAAVPFLLSKPPPGAVSSLRDGLQETKPGFPSRYLARAFALLGVLHEERPPHRLTSTLQLVDKERGLRPVCKDTGGNRRSLA